MKILGLSFSPRKNGSTVLLLNEALAAAKEAGAETELYSISGKNILIDKNVGISPHGNGDTVGRPGIDQFFLPVFEPEFQFGMECIIDHFVNDEPFKNGLEPVHDGDNQIMGHRPGRFDTGKLNFDAGSFKKTDNNGKLAFPILLLQNNDLILPFFVNNDFA